MDGQPLGNSVHWCLIWTLDRIKSLCIECGDCWEWQGALMRNRYPTIRYKMKNTSARRAVYDMSGRRLYKQSFIVTTCGNSLCLNPKHLKQMTQGERMKQLAPLGIQGGMARAAKIAKTKREQMAKITMDDAHAIRASEESCKVLAQRYGLSPERVNRIRNGTAWREYINNPFAGLLPV